MVFSDVVDDEAGWRAYRALGPDAIFTNDPAGLVAFVKGEQVEPRRDSGGDRAGQKA